MSKKTQEVWHRITARCFTTWRFKEGNDPSVLGPDAGSTLGLSSGFLRCLLLMPFMFQATTTSLTTAAVNFLWGSATFARAGAWSMDDGERHCNFSVDTQNSSVSARVCPKPQFPANWRTAAAIFKENKPGKWSIEGKPNRFLMLHSLVSLVTFRTWTIEERCSAS